jgi:hypothetical protein
MIRRFRAALKAFLGPKRDELIAQRQALIIDLAEARRKHRPRAHIERDLKDVTHQILQLRRGW